MSLYGKGFQKRYKQIDNKIKKDELTFEEAKRMLDDEMNYLGKRHHSIESLNAASGGKKKSVKN